MALTRAQLLAGNDNDGVVLPGQPQGVIAGTGITISNTGVISVDSSTITGFVRLNNPLGYNSYTWPQIPGVSGQFLQTSGVSGVLTWADAKGFAVVTVQPQPAPSPTDEGELWFDCTTGTLKIYQTCVAPGGWTDVNQSGLPVDPAQTTSSVPWTGTGTTGDPYVMSVTTVGSGSSVFVVNTVTVAGLAPFQYVPIVDLNAVANGGRFSFSNYYANAAGTLTFQTIFTDQPASPPTTTYTANIRVGYATAYINAVVNIVTPLALTQGVISGTPTVNTAVSYTPGTPSGGLTPYTTAYQWFADGLPILGATTSSYTPVAGDVGKTLSVTQTVTDASGASVSSTATAGSATIYAPIPNWTPTGSMNTIPGGLSGTYSGPGTTMTATGCIEVSINGGSYGAGGPVTSGQVVAIRWKTTVACGGAATPTVIQGSLTDGVGQNDYSVTVNRVPDPTINDISDTNVPLNATVSEGIASPIAGLTTTAYVTYDASSTGTAIGASLTPGGPFTALATSGQGFAITNGQTLYIEQTVGSGLGVGYTAVIRVGDGTNAAGTYDEFVYTATTTSTPAFPTTVFGPSAADPNATPDTVSIAADPQLGALEGKAITDASGWQDGNGVSLTATNMLLSVGGAPFASSVTVNNGESLAVAWDPTYISGITDGTAVTGDFTDTTYTNSYGYTVDKDPAFALPAPPPAAAATNAPLGGTVATGVLTVDEYNSPIDVTISSVTTGTAIDLTNVAYEIDTNGQVPVASLPHTFTLNPGESVQFFGDTGTATLQEYGYTVTMGAAAAQEWLVETANVPPSIATPTIDLPLANATGVNPGVNSPSEIVIEGSTYSPQGGAGAQTSGIFELYEAIPFNPETSVITAVNQGVDYNTMFTPLPNTVVAGGPFGVSPASSSNYSVFAGTGSGVAPGSLATTITFSPPLTGVTSLSVICAFASSGLRSVGISVDGGATQSFSPGAWSSAGSPLPAPCVLTAPATVNTISFINTNVGSWGLVLFDISVNGNRLLSNPTVLTLTDDQDLADMQVGDTLTQDSAYTPLTSAITFVATNTPAAGQTTLTLTDDTDLYNFSVGDAVTEVGGGGDATGTIIAIDSVSVPPTITLSPTAGTWDINSQVQGVARTGTGVISAINSGAAPYTVSLGGWARGWGANAGKYAIDSRVTVKPAPTTEPPDPTYYTATTGSPYASTTPVPPTKPSANVPAADLDFSTTYYTRAKYSTTSPSNIDSNYSAWSKFTTASTFYPFQPGDQVGGGYFIAQIMVFAGEDDGVSPAVDTIYNLIIAPTIGDNTGPNPGGTLLGQTSGYVSWKNANTGETGADIPLAQNLVYGKPWTDRAGTTGNFPVGEYPLFQWCVGDANGPNGGGGIGGFTDWYIPAWNELRIIYFFFKPSPQVNSPIWGSNPNSLPPYTPNTNYSNTGSVATFPAQTVATDFRSGGSEAMHPNWSWSSSELSGDPTRGWRQAYYDGQAQGMTKVIGSSGRAIRRVPA